MARSRNILASPEDVLVAVSCETGSEDLIRRGARLARRLGGSCIVVTVQSGGGAAHLERYRALATQLGASFAVLGGSDVVAEVVEAARSAGAEHVVIGEERDSGGTLSRLRPTVVDRIIDGLPNSDIHVIARKVA